MPNNTITTIGGINTYVNPLGKDESSPIRSVNLDSYPYGGKSKRSGYGLHLGTMSAGTVTHLFNWTKDNGDFYNYGVSDNKVFYSTNGTGAWAVTGNGTVTSANYVGHAVLDNILFICDGAGSTRHTANGTAFTDTVLAPVGVDVASYQGRIYVAGTASTAFYSSALDGTNWNTSGTSDSSSFSVPGEGRLLKADVIADRLQFSKTSGVIQRWDGYELVNTGSRLAPTSPWSVSDTEGFFFWINRLGYFGNGGDRPQLLSNAIQRQIYNKQETGIVGTVFDTVRATTHRHDYFASVGTTSDDLIDVDITNCIQKYNIQTNEWLNYSYGVQPTALLSYRDATGDQQLIFGDANGQCYIVDGSYSDNGTPIETVLEFVHHGGIPYLDKKWEYLTAFFNPGNQAKVQVAMSDTFTRDRLKWIELGDCSDGVVEFRFPQGSRSKFLFVKIYESSRENPFTFYGYDVQSQPILRS